MQRPEDELFLRFRRTGDADLLGEVYDLVAPGLLHAASHLARDPAQAEDVLQGTLLAALERREAFDPERGTLKAWLFGILARQAKRARHVAGREPDPKRLRESLRADLTPPERAAAEELKASLGNALERQPAALRPVLTLRLLHGLTPAEIAVALDRPPGTVRSQLQRGLEGLRCRLPAGFTSVAGVLALLERPSRGLAAVKAEVLAHGASLPIATAASTTLLSTLTGALLMKKTVTALVVALAAAGWWALRDDRPAPLELAGPAPPAGAGNVLPSEARPGVEASREPVAPRVEEAVSGATRVPPATPAREASEEVAPPTGRLLVEVRDAFGAETVAGEMVTLDVNGAGATFRHRLTVRTDDDGVASFEELPVGHVYARLLRGGEDGAMIAEGRTARLALRLFQGITVVGEVVDADERPIAEAEVWVSERWRTNSGFVLRRADRAGRFRLAHLTRDHYVGVRAAGYAGSYLLPVSGDEGATVSMRFVLADRGGELSGRVVDQDGEPVARALVLVGEERNYLPSTGRLLAGDQFVPGTPPEHAVTDADGAFRVSSVPLDEVPVQARRLGFATTTASARITAGESWIELTLVAGGSLRGRVTDADGDPLVGVLVRSVDRYDAFAGSYAYTQLDGTYALHDLVPGEQTFFAVQERSGAKTEAELRVEAGRTLEWNPVLESGPRIFGRVTDAAGFPVEDLTVVAMLPETGPDTRMRSQRTDAAGRFTIAVEDGERSHTLWVQGPGGWRSFPELILHDVRAGEELTLVLGDAHAVGTITAEVIDGEGVPVDDASLGVWHFEERIWRELPVEQGTGRFLVERVPAGRVSIEVRSTAFPKEHLGERTVVAGEVLDLGTLSLAGSGFLVGELRGEPAQSGELLRGVRFHLLGADFRPPGAIERTARTFRSTPLEAGHYFLRVSGDHLVEQRLEVDVREGEETYLAVDLQRAGLRRLVFEGVEGGEPPPSMWLQILAGERGVWTDYAVMRTPEGELSADVSVLPGAYTFRGGTPDGLVVQGELDVVGYGGTQPPLVVRFTRP